MVLTHERKNAIIKGAILGAIVLALSIFSFYFITEFVKTPVLALIGLYSCSMIIPLAVVVVLSLIIRKDAGGYLTFRQAVTAIFTMLFTCYIILSVGRDLLFVKLIEPNMVQKTEVAMLNNSRISYAQQGLPEKEIESKLLERKKEFSSGESISISTFISGLVYNVLMLFVLAVILGAIFKKEPPYTTPANNEA